MVPGTMLPDAGHKHGTGKLVSAPPPFGNSSNKNRQKQQRGWYAVRPFSSSHLNRIEDGMQRTLASVWHFQISRKTTS
jgi:hypothetical protein